MSYSDDPLRDAERWLAEQEAAENAAIAAQTERYAEFLSACRELDASAPATFAPMVRDFVPLQPFSAVSPIRHQTVSEVLGDSLDLDGPAQVELHQLLLNLAYGKSTLAELQSQANALVVRCAAAWACDG